MKKKWKLRLIIEVSGFRARKNPEGVRIGIYRGMEKHMETVGLRI